MRKITWELPLKTISEGNSGSEHWSAKNKRHKMQQFFIRSLFAHEAAQITLPCIVKFTRLSPRELDDDNLTMAFKWIRDEVSECLIPEKRSVYVTKQGKVREIKGRADSDPRIIWQYAQEKARLSGVRIEISFEENQPQHGVDCVDIQSLSLCHQIPFD